MREVLSILQVEDPSLRTKDLHYYNRTRKRWRLFVRGKNYFYYDRHLHYVNHGFGKAVREYLECLRELVCHHIKFNAELCSSIIQSILKRQELLPLLIGIDSRLDTAIEKELLRLGVSGLVAGRSKT